MISHQSAELKRGGGGGVGGGAGGGGQRLGKLTFAMRKLEYWALRPGEVVEHACDSRALQHLRACVRE